MNCKTTQKSNSEASPTPSLSVDTKAISGNWYLTKMEDPKLEFNKMKVTEIPFIIIKGSESTLEGRDGCNRIWCDIDILTEETIECGSLNRTKIGCKLDQAYDNKFRLALSNTRYYTVIKNTLTLLDEEKNKLLVFNN